MAGIIDPGKYFNTSSLKKKLKELYSDLGDVNNRLNDLVETTKKSNESIKKQSATQTNTNNAIKDYNKNLNTLTQTEKELIRIQKASEKISVDTAKAQIELTKKRKEARQEAEKQLGVTKQQIPFTQKMAGAFKVAATQIVAVVAAIRGIIKGVTEYVKLTVEVNKQTSQVAATFGLAKKEARDLTVEIRKTSTAFDKEFNDVFKSATIISKEFGITGDEAISLINEGFEKGADINGEYLELLKEYPAQLKTVGLSADETIAIITQTEREGVFSDKGIDAIKEAGIRLRELTPATRSALDAIGLSSKEIERSLADGSKTLYQVIQEVSTQLDTLPPQSAMVGTAIADIFGGPGEDAGLRFLTTLKDINTDLSVIESTLSKDEQASIRLRSVWEELRTSSVGSGGFITLIKNGLADLLEFILKFRKDFVGNWNELIKNSEIFRGSISLLGNTVKLNFRLMFDSIKLVFEPLKGLARIIKAVLTGNISEIKSIAKDTFSSMKNDVISMKDSVMEAGVNIKNAFTGESLDKFMISTEGATNRIKAFNTEYTKTSGNIINKGREIIDMNLLEIKTIQEVNGQKLSEEEELTNAKIALEEKLTEKVKEEEEKRTLSAQERYGAVQDLANGTFDFLTSLRERDLEAIDESEQYKLNLVGDNEQAQEKIRAEADKKRREIKRKQAIADKAQGIFNAAINTALAITSALTIPPPAGPILAVINGVLGGIQIATIAAKQIPKFAKGTGKDGLGRGMVAEFGERGREIVMEPNSMPYIAENPTIDYLPKGTKIYSNPDTEKILTKGGVTPDHFNELIKEVRNNKPTIINKSTTITERGFEHEIRKGNTRIRLMNKYLGR